jgi:hypothetical protein
MISHPGAWPGVALHRHQKGVRAIGSRSKPGDDGGASIHRHRGDVDEPALRLHDALHLGDMARGPTFVRDPHEGRFLDDAGVELAQRRVARLGLEASAASAISLSNSSLPK